MAGGLGAGLMAANAAYLPALLPRLLLRASHLPHLDPSPSTPPPLPPPPPPPVYVADSYNHRLKALDPSSASLRTLAGAGAPGSKDGAGAAAQLSEPGGLALGPDGA